MAHTDQSNHIKRIRAAYAPTAEDAQQMIHMLAENGIDAVVQGGSRDIYTVGGVFGVEIMVPEEDLERAGDLLRAMTGDNAPAPEPAHFGRRSVLSLAIAGILLALLICLRNLIG